MTFRETWNSAKFPISGTEYVQKIYGIWSQRAPATIAPSRVVIATKVELRKTDDPCWFKFPVLRFDAYSGGWLDRYGEGLFESGNGLVFNLENTEVYELPGTAYAVESQEMGGRLIVANDLSVYNFTANTYTAEGTTLFPPAGYWGSVDPTEPTFIYDPITNRFAQNSNSAGQGEVAVYVASTGADTGIRIQTGSIPVALVGMESPYGLAFARNGIVTIFDYLNGQVLAMSKMPDFDTGADTGSGAYTTRKYGYDRYNHRILMADITPKDSGDFSTILIRGFNPIPVPHKIMPPIATREPRVNRVAKIFTRVIGAAGEGISQVAVTFTDQSVGAVDPITVVTDQYGYAIADYDGLTTGGAETISVSVEQPGNLFDPSTAQGSGASLAWAPNPHLDFNGQQENADVSTILSEQTDWTKGLLYGVYGDTSITRPSKSSSARLTIESGTTGTPADGTNGSFGGNLQLTAAGWSAFDSTSLLTVRANQELWVGAWVYFPTGFSFSTSSQGLRIFTLRYNAPSAPWTVVEVHLKHGGGSTHTGWTLEWPDETVTEANHDFTAHSSGLVSFDTWHFVQYYVKVAINPIFSVQRLWLDSVQLWELDNQAGKYLNAAGGGSLTSFTAAEAIQTMGLAFGEVDELQVFNNWEGGAPSDQTCYVSNVVWTRDVNQALPKDAQGNRYISPGFAQNL